MTEYSSGEGVVFVQPDGPNTKPLYLGCHDLGELEEPLGDPALWLCKDPAMANSFKTSRIVKGTPGLVTTSLTTNVYQTASYLEELADNTPLYVKLHKLGRPDAFPDYDRVFAGRFIASNRKRANLAMGRSESVERGEFTIDLSAGPPLRSFFDLTERAQRVTVAETEALNNIVFCDPDCETGFVAADAVALGTANVLDANGWAALAAVPFTADEHIIGAVCFPLDRSTERIIVARGSADAANPAEIAYSDDGGATWTLVNVGATNGQYAPDSGALFALDQHNIWLTTQDGYIYYSDDGGLTWTAQESGSIQTGAYNAIYFKNALEGMAVGAAGVVAITLDGGLTWSAATAVAGGNALTTVSNSDLFWWVGDDGGNLNYSSNSGTTWTARSFSGSGAGDVAAVKFVDEFFGVLVHNTSAPLGRIFVTIDGGFGWRKLTIPTNGGLNDIWVCSTRKLWSVGEASGGTGYVVKIESPLT